MPLVGNSRKVTRGTDSQGCKGGLLRIQEKIGLVPYLIRWARRPAYFGFMKELWLYCELAAGLVWKMQMAGTKERGIDRNSTA